MGFSDSDLHDTMKFVLETLIYVIKSSDDNEKKTIAAVNLANILFEIEDRQSGIPITDLEYLQDEEEDE